jgi:ABC-2 type transport system permease protein
MANLPSKVVTDESVINPNFRLRNNNKTQAYYTQEIYALTKRLLIQGWRRPSLIITGVIQPLLWLLLFGALFQNAPIDLFTSTEKYSNFISAGIIVFTAFTGSLNAGLPLIFDREFGFLNRLLSSPVHSRYSIIYSSSLNITFTSFLQVSSIIYICSLMGYSIPNLKNAFLVSIMLFLLSNSITSVSLILAFILPGHVELLACLIIINLPLLFSSTALAPLIFMPSWLQIIASLNPLSYTIETIRFAYICNSWSYTSSIMQTVWGPINILAITVVMILINFLSIGLVQKLVANKFEE